MNLIEQIAISPSFLLRKIASNYAAEEERMKRQKRKFYGAKVFQRTLKTSQAIHYRGSELGAAGEWRIRIAIKSLNVKKLY